MDKLFRPSAMKPGDTAALAAPSSPAFDTSRIDFAAGYLKELGFKVNIGQSCYATYGYLAGNDRLRADDINRAFANPDVKGIFCLRGGYGAGRILDMLDYNTIRTNPKFFCGYSDITALHCAINQQTGLMTFHTPVVGESTFPKADGYTLANMNKYIFEQDISGQIVNSPGEAWQFLNAGTARGILCGGNLSVLASLMGTAYEPDTRGKIIFIEDVGEKPYRIDRMLNQLRLGGKFEKCAGVIFGSFTDCNPGNPAASLTILEIINNLALDVPVLYNLRAGHCLPTTSLPMGAVVQMDSAANSLHILRH